MLKTFLGMTQTPHATLAKPMRLAPSHEGLGSAPLDPLTCLIKSNPPKCPPWLAPLWLTLPPCWQRHHEIYPSCPAPCSRLGLPPRGLLANLLHIRARHASFAMPTSITFSSPFPLVNDLAPTSLKQNPVTVPSRPSQVTKPPSYL
ncbi:hypothetical protein CK203_055281 [Vitis vinifera]|uniref:Uncharacterized protein n=1 Tax=Vitis vinifera TaxID=29760 RepID=A0A438GTV1_VITVI|nr:hypothetical protein CK203_055281 [Vitis vinifera]